MRITRLGLPFGFIALLTSAVLAVPPDPEGDARYWDGYHLALRQLRDGQWRQSETTLTETEKQFRGDMRLLLARGVTRTLLADYANARDDLSRVNYRDSREHTLWMYAIAAMNDDLRIGGNIQWSHQPRRHGPGEPQAQRPKPFLGVPGHIVQGGKDYSSDYASFVIYEMAMPYRESLEKQQRIDEAAFHRIQVAAGRWFANRMLTSADLSSRNYVWAQQLLKANQLAEAREVLQLARAYYPLEADLAAAAADLWLRVGRPATARRDYTIALTTNAAHPTAYLGRAVAAAMMGDGPRARADLEAAKAIGADIRELTHKLDQLLAEVPVDADPAGLLTQLDQAALKGATVDDLQPNALRLHRALNPRRLRYDEVYQDNLRRFDQALRADPKNLEAMLGLVHYLLEELDSRGENVEPRRGLVNYRPGGDRAFELSRALYYADQALQLQPKSARTLLMKAMVLAEQGQEQAAYTLCEQAAQTTDGADAQAVRLLAQFRRRLIGRLLGTAAALRTPTFSSSSHDEHRYDGVWRVTTTYRYDPSPADLARADQLEAQARRLMDATRTTMEAAIKASAGTLDGYLLQANYEDWFGSRAKALGLLQMAVKEFPREIRGHDALVQYLRLTGQRDLALEAEAGALQLVHTTCGPLLSKAWLTVDQGGFGPMVELLQRARQLDPADARATAYLAEAERDLRNKEGAVAYFKVAAALETARLQIDDQGEARTWSRPADDMATLMACHNLLGKAAQMFKQDEQEIAHYEATMALARRFGPDGRKTPMFGAVFLQARAMQVPVAPTPNGATVASEACLAAGHWYKNHGRMADAERCWELSGALGQPARNDPFPGRAKPRIGNTRGDANFGEEAATPSAESLIELAKLKIARREYKAAAELLQQATQANPTREMRREINELFMQIKDHL